MDESQRANRIEHKFMVEWYGHLQIRIERVGGCVCVCVCVCAHASVVDNRAGDRDQCEHGDKKQGRGDQTLRKCM